MPSVSTVREAGQRAGWNAAKVADMLGMNRDRLFRLQRDGNAWPTELADDVERVMVLAAAEERRLRLAAEAFDVMLAGWKHDVQDWRTAVIAEGRLAAATVDAYLLHIGWLARDLAGEVPDPWQVTAHRIEAWIDDHNWSSATRRKVLVSLRTFYGWGVLDGRCQRSPIAGVASLTRQKSGPKPVSRYPAAWHDPMYRYQDYLIAGGASRGTRRLYSYCLSNLAQHFPDPWSVTLPELVRYCARPDLAPETRKTIRSALRGFYRWAEETGAMPADMANPAAKLPPVRVPRALPRPATDDAVVDALRSADERTRLALLIALYTGARMAEIARLHSRDVGERSILLRGKGERERMVPMHDELRAELHAELRRRQDGGPLLEAWGPTVPRADGYLFPHPWTGEPLTPAHMSRLVARALPGRWTGHTLRHRFATQAYARDRDLRAVQELLGHAKPETTAVYAQVPGDSLLRAVENVGPVSRSLTASQAP